MSIIEKLTKTKIIKENSFEEKEPEFISTGCLSLNVLFSGQLDGGIQKGKVSGMAAESAQGKSFTAMKVARNAQKQGMEVLLMDTEYSYSPSFATAVGVDPDKLLVVQNNQVEEVQQILVSSVQELSKEERENLLIIIDSWGAVVTSKTMLDAQSGKDVTDMTVSRKKNSFARVLTGLGCTVFIVAQVYSTMDQYNPIALQGGKGLRYACTSIVMGTSKAKSKDGQDVDGVIISAKAEKGRLAVENSKLKFLIKFDGGIHPYYGLLPDALEGGYIEKPTMGWYSRPCVEDDKKWREKEIWDNSPDFWNPIIQNTDFKQYIEKKYSFKHNEIQQLHSDEDDILDYDPDEEV